MEYEIQVTDTADDIENGQTFSVDGVAVAAVAPAGGVTIFGLAGEVDADKADVIAQALANAASTAQTRRFEARRESREAVLDSVRKKLTPEEQAALNL